MAQRKSDLGTISTVAQLLAVVLTVAALYFARDVFIPLAVGTLLSFLLSPVVNRLQSWGVSNVLAVGVTAALTFIVLAVGFTIVGRELSRLVGELPQHKSELIAKARGIAGLATGVGGSLDKLATEVSQAMEEEGAPAGGAQTNRSTIQRWADKVFPSSSADGDELPNDGSSDRTPLYVQEVRSDIPLASWATTVGTVLGPLTTAGLVSVFALFMLVHRQDLRDRIIAVVSHGNYVTTTEALNEAAGRISRYLIAQTIVNTSYGSILAIGLVAIGTFMTPDGAFPNALLWGVLATCLRFVPYLGPIAAAVFPLSLALSVFPGYGVFAAVLGLIIVMELLSNNILEPWLYGTSTGISAVAVIVAAVFWGWLWGPVGLLLSTPLTVCLVVLGRYVPRFKIFATLLGEDVEISTSMRFYQRLLASDQQRAHDLLKQHLTEKDFDATCDQVLIPALKRIRSDHDAEHLSDSDANRLMAMLGGLIDELSDQVHSDVQVDADSGPHRSEREGLPVVLGCTSHDFISETLVLNLLRIGLKGICRLEGIEDDALPQEVGQRVREAAPAAVVIAVLPKGGFTQARYLCKSIRQAGYGGPIVMVCPGRFKNFDKLFVKFRKVGANNMTTSVSQARSKLETVVKYRKLRIDIPVVAS